MVSLLLPESWQFVSDHIWSKEIWKYGKCSSEDLSHLQLLENLVPEVHSRAPTGPNCVWVSTLTLSSLSPPFSVYIVSWTNPSASTEPFGVIPLWTRIHRGGKQTGQWDGLLDLQTQSLACQILQRPHHHHPRVKNNQHSSHWPDRRGALRGYYLSEVFVQQPEEDTHMLCLDARNSWRSSVISFIL